MRFYVRYRDPIFPWDRRLRGIVLYPFVFMRAYKPEDFRFKEEEKSLEFAERRNKILFRHELEHCYQIKRMGVFKFYFGYIKTILKTGYDKHPYEIEAENREDDPLTEQELKMFNERKIKI